ncbi:hypothetical protein C0J52_11682 [Blattella germanica]|nr:hypothetical protein C0J52_11682 [Blattella germanica]
MVKMRVINRTVHVHLSEYGDRAFVVEVLHRILQKLLPLFDDPRRVEESNFSRSLPTFRIRLQQHKPTDFVRVTKGGFGIRDANGSWNGITGMMEGKFVDVGLLTLALSASRLSVMDYFVPVKTSRKLSIGSGVLTVVQNVAALIHEESKDPVMMEAYKKLVLAEKSHPTGIDDGLRRICERERYAYMVMNLYQKQIRPDLGLRCSYVALPHFSIPASFGIACTKNSPLKRIINY